MVARSLGSTHDSHILRTSAVGRQLEGGSQGLEERVLLGDSGYPCTKFLMTPYTQPESPSQEKFNRAHKTCCVFERSFGLLKCRFHILHSEIRMSPDRVCTIIAACFVLHNIAVSLREPEVDYDDKKLDDADFDVQEQYQGPENGKAVRSHITDRFF